MNKLYTIQEVADKLNISDKTLRRWEDAGRFVASRTLGNQRRYSTEDLQILDAIKHGTISDQKELLTIEQAGLLCGVSPATILRWENDGKIHPFITSGTTYYPKTKLVEKLTELKRANIEHPPSPKIEPVSPPPPRAESRSLPKLNLPADIKSRTLVSNQNFNVQGSIFNVLVTIILIISYHFFFNTSPSLPASPQSGSVQGAATISDPTLDLLRTILDPSGALTTTTLTSRAGLISPMLSLSPTSAPADPAPGTIYYDAASQSLKIFKGNRWTELSPMSTYQVGESKFITGSATLHKGKNQVSVSHPNITDNTPVTLTFTSDYAPAKKYWVIAGQGEFTLYTDFPVSSDSPFNYNLMTTIDNETTPDSNPSSIPLL